MAAVLSAGRLGWRFQNAYTILTDLDDVLDLRVDSPAAVKNAVDESVIRWRAANLLEEFTATSDLLKTWSMPPVDIVPGMESQWKRAAAMAHIQHFPDVLGSLTSSKDRADGCTKKRTG